jgi:hypothetical protein
MVQRLADGGGTRLVFDSVASAVSAYQDEDTLPVARRVDVAVLTLLRRVAAVAS